MYFFLGKVDLALEDERSPAAHKPVTSAREPFGPVGEFVIVYVNSVENEQELVIR